MQIVKCLKEDWLTMFSLKTGLNVYVLLCIYVLLSDESVFM